MHEPEQMCACCEPDKLARLGEDVIEVLEKILARLKVIRHVRPRYACRVCEAVFQAPAPDLPIERGRPGPSLIAHVAVSKYCDGLPLFRQSVILAREGVEIDRITLADWIGRAAWWLAPLARLVGATVMAHSVQHTDDTPIRTLAPGTGKTRLARFWVYAVDPRSHGGPAPLAAFYQYSAGRKGERPLEHLAGFAGVMHADAFAGYDALHRAGSGQPATSSMPRAGCMPGASCSRRMRPPGRPSPRVRPRSGRTGAASRRSIGSRPTSPAAWLPIERPSAGCAASPCSTS